MLGKVKVQIKIQLKYSLGKEVALPSKINIKIIMKTTIIMTKNVSRIHLKAVIPILATKVGKINKTKIS